MSEQKMAMQSDLPKAIGRPATQALHVAGYTHLAQLTERTTREVLALHGFGPRALRVLREALAERGQTFADERPE